MTTAFLNGNSWPQPGTVVWIPTHLFYRHKGIVSDHWFNGKPMIISNSGRSGGVQEEPWDVFAEGKEVKADGYPGNLPWYQVVARARSLIGTQYDLFNWNCEHFVAQVHGLAPQSPQVAATLAVAMLCLGVLAAVK